MKDYIITGPTIYAGQDQILQDHAVVVEDGRISAIVPESDVAKYSGERLSYSSQAFIAPGMIDMHIHGANGADVMDADIDALQTIGASLLKEGTTGFLATTMTASPDAIESALSAVKTYHSVIGLRPAAQILGVHLEGPFLSPQQPGAQDAKWVVPPDINLFHKWQQASGDQIKLITVAPEMAGALPFIETLSKQNVLVSAGHTDCSSDVAHQAIDCGASHATHLYNAMSGIHHRQPGAALALLLDPRVMVELIADGVHLGPEIMQLTLNVAGRDRIVLVTDATRAKCMGDGVFELGGQKIMVKGNEARLQNGVLAGSVLTLNRACENMLAYPGVTQHDIIRMTSMNPARHLGIGHDYGSIDVGKYANLVIFDQSYQVIDVFVAD